MLDINLIREQPEVVRKSLADRQDSAAPVDQILELDRQRRETILETESLKAQRNAASKEIGKAKDPAERQAK
ncbi:MAG TPA: serine--tRNA ligase, partial [Anaerolineales bacterium]